MKDKGPVMENMQEEYSRQDNKCKNSDKWIRDTMHLLKAMELHSRVNLNA